MILNHISTDHCIITGVCVHGYICITSGMDYITISALEDEYIEGVQRASDLTNIKVFLANTQDHPDLCKQLGVNAVPAIYHIVEGKVVGSMVGVASAEQVQAYLLTGVSPL